MLRGRIVKAGLDFLIHSIPPHAQKRQKCRQAVLLMAGKKLEFML